MAIDVGAKLPAPTISIHKVMSVIQINTAYAASRQFTQNCRFRSLAYGHMGVCNF